MSDQTLIRTNAVKYLRITIVAAAKIEPMFFALSRPFIAVCYLWRGLDEVEQKR